jgi:P-type Mg2+ transporter
MALGDLSDGLIILVIVAASGALGFWQERTAGHAVDALMAQVRVAVEVRRGGGQVSVPVEEVVVGDLVVLRAGDVVPADGRVVRSRELLVDEAALTGESYAVEKRPGVVAADTPLAARRLRTGFERGITQFGVLLVRAMVVLVTAIFVVNLVLHRPLVDSLLFSLALAVGLAAQLLPAIVSVSLSAGPGGWRPTRSSSSAWTPSRTSAP